MVSPFKKFLSRYQPAFQSIHTHFFDLLKMVCHKLVSCFNKFKNTSPGKAEGGKYFIFTVLPDLLSYRLKFSLSGSAGSMIYKIIFSSQLTVFPAKQIVYIYFINAPTLTTQMEG